MENNELSIYDENYLKSKIYIIRGVQVMIDADLAEIYGYSTKRFNEQVKNNIERFDEDMRFRLTSNEYDVLRSKISTSKTSQTDYKSTTYNNAEVLRSKILTSNNTKRGGSSKDGGRKITSITKVNDVMLYRNIINNLENNPRLQL